MHNYPSIQNYPLNNVAVYEAVISELHTHPSILSFAMLGLGVHIHVSALPWLPFGTCRWWVKQGDHRAAGERGPSSLLVLVPPTTVYTTSHQQSFSPRW